MNKLTSTFKKTLTLAGVCLALNVAKATQVLAACGQLEVAKGDVRILSGATKATASAAVGVKVCAGDTVITAADSRAKLRMEDGNELNISPDSKIALDTYQFEPAQNKKKVLLNILQGKVRAATKHEAMYNDKAADGSENSFQVRTKSAVAGVRGTDFVTSYDPKTNASSVITFRGNVSFGLPGPSGSIVNAVAVLAGQTSFANAGQAPAVPQTVPAAKLLQLNKDSNSSGAASVGVGVSGANGGGGGGGPKPASTGGGSMLSSGDLAGGAINGGSGLTASPSTAVQFVPPPVQGFPPPPPVCSQCTAVIQNTPAKVNVVIHLPGQ